MSATQGPRICFVAEQFVPPVNDGSTYVYRNWIDFLSERCELYSVFFALRDGDRAEADSYLARRCRAHLILPGPSSSRLMKSMRAASRFLTGTLFGPRWLEEFGRSGIHRLIVDFAARHEIGVFLLSKLISIPLFGARNIRTLKASFILDMHDDFVVRDKTERRVLAELLAQFPSLRRYARFRHMLLRHHMSRLVEHRARAQEGRMLGLFDGLLAASSDEHLIYRSMLRGAVPCDFVGWPPAPHAASVQPRPEFDAGFIGGDHPFNIEGAIFFCTRILPIIRRRRPDFKFLIAGQAAAPLAMIGPHWPGVEFGGYVPDASSLYRRVALCVVPILSGTGASVKTLEALAMGKPVVATRMGARGCDGKGHDPMLAIADDPEEFAGKVLMLCDGAASSARDRGHDDEFAVAFDRLLRRHGMRLAGSVADDEPDCAPAVRPPGLGARHP
jgi:glycosyltransferase involved in cell wall biosynthesis